MILIFIISQMKKSREKILKVIKKTYWRTSGLILWLWLLDAIITKFNLIFWFTIPNQVLFFLLLAPIYYLIKLNFWVIFKFLIYLLVFPFWIPILSIKLIVLIVHLLNFIYSISYKFIDLTTQTIGTLCLLLGFILIQTIIIKIDLYQYQLYLIISNSLVMLLLILSVLKWAHDPYRPARTFQKLIIKIGEKLKKLYHEKIILQTLIKKNYKKIKDELETLNKLEKKFISFKDSNLEMTINLRKNIAIVSIFVFFLLISVIVFGFGGSILCFNRIAFEEATNQETNIVFFESLPVNASYFECVFHSFTIMTTSQDFNLGNTSNLAKMIVVAEILSIFFVFSMIISIFFTNLGSDESPALLTLGDVKRASESTIKDWKHQLESSIKPTAKKLDVESQIDNTKKESESESKT
ncbi:MAG: hypothetical protein GF353_07660 [Candidatus Lokiarchaeota archaeon]|nr:hypothetical protein [Candidatus Lokiarchaeota archaeon]